MINVWKCDFCSFNSKDKSVVFKHESSCDYNPIRKKCYSCFHYNEKNKNFIISQCKIDGVSMLVMKFGNCNKWVPKNEHLLRLIKIKKLIK